jgi:hypothetical protein
MSVLLELLHNSRDSVLKMDIDAIVRVAGRKLVDGGDSSIDFRSFLSEVDEEKLAEYATYCLENSFPDSGQVLQDIINEIGRRLGYIVENGRYHGVRNDIGFDGIWSNENGKLVIEVKTTDAYTIKLDTIATYRDKLGEIGKVTKDTPILLVIGRNDTHSLEAQVRGSRHAWSMRIIGIDALIKLMRVNLATSTKDVTDKIHLILEPFEYTRVDGIVDVIFTATEDKESETEDIEIGLDESDNVHLTVTQNRTPREFIDKKKELLIRRFGEKIGRVLVKRKNSLFADKSDEVHTAIAISKKYTRSDDYYWYAYHDIPQRKFLSESKNGYMIFGMTDVEISFAIPYEILEKYWEHFWSTTKKNGLVYKHILVFRVDKKFILRIKSIDAEIDLTEFSF